VYNRRVGISEIEEPLERLWMRWSY